MSLLVAFPTEMEKVKAALAAQPAAARTARGFLKKVESELKQIFIKTRGGLEDKVFEHINTLVGSVDSVERILGLVSILAYSEILNENEILSFVNKFTPTVSEKIFFTTDESLIDLGVEVYGILVGLGGINIAQQIEDKVNASINNLNKPDKRYPSLMMLVELLKHAQFITFNKIRKYKYKELFKSIILEKKPNYKRKGLELIDECIKEISKRDRTEQANILSSIWTELFKERQEKNLDSEVNSGVMTVLKSLLTYSNKDVFVDNFKDICNFVNQMKGSKTVSHQQIVLELYPILSSYQPELFAKEGYLDKAIEHIKRLLPSQNGQLKKSAHLSLGKLLDPYNADEIKERAKLILDELYKEVAAGVNKTDPALLPCMVSISQKVHKSFKQFFSEEQTHELVNLLLAHGISEDVLSFLEFLLTVDQPNIAYVVQAKLLFTVSYILTNKFYNFMVSQAIADKYMSSIEIFKTNLEKNIKGLSKDTSNENLICVSLSCLSRFSFQDFSDQMGSFVKDVALVFLEDIRPSLRKAAAKAVTLLNVRSNKGVGLSHNMMSQILNKLLSIAISDPDDDVREIMLGSLNKNFNSYLRHRSNLQSLILALNDSNDKVQKRAIVILRRLISSNASEIVPALQNSLYRILRVINMKSSDNEKDIIQNLKLLSCFISNAPFMLKNQRDLIFKFLLSPLQNQKTTQIVTTEIFATLSSLVCIAKSSTIRYFDQLIQVLLTSLEDMGSTKKRIEAIRCLSNVVRTSGLVVFVNYKYVSLNDLIFALFQVEANPEARSELMRLMGFLGALDCFNLFKVQSNTDLATLSTKELIDVIRSNHKSKFFFEKLVVSWQAPEDQCEFRLKEFFQNIINMNQVLDKGGVEEGLNQIIELNTIGTKGREDRDLLARTGPTPMVTQDSIKELLAMNDPITLGDTDSLLSYTTVVTLKTLLLNLFDQSLLLNHKFILDDLNMIVYTIGKEIAPYLYLLVPCLSHYISSSSAHLNREILELFEKILKICGHKFGEQSQRNVDLLIEIILKNLTLPKCKEKSLDTMIELIDSNKSMLKFKVQTICLHLLQLLLPANEPPSIIDKIFKILNMVQEYNESFLHLILPSFCRILNSCKNVENVMFIKGIIKYIQSILDFDLALQHMSSIVHCLIRAITDRDDVREEAKECIIALVLAFKDDALIYLPLINAAFNTNGMKNDPKFKIITDKLKLNGDLEDLDTLEDNFSKRGGDSGGANTHAYQPMSGKDLKGTESPQKTIETIRHFNSESVKNLFDVSSNFLKEDWEEWLTKTSNELIINSPSKVLFCCKSFANVNPNIAKDLFNVGFAMIWSQFNDSQKCLVIQNIEQAINNPNVPLTVLKTILNLAEFMEHDNQGLQLDITSMAKLAEKCNAHAKALYYREFEFNFCPDESIESLISLYSSLGQPEAASGMLVFAKNVLGTKVKESWLEALGRWDEALEGYNAVETRTRDDKVNNLKDKIRCYDALAQWELVLEKSDEFVKDGFELGEIAHYASRASIQLGRWSQLEKFAEKVNSRKEDNNYFDAIMAINMKDYKSAKLAIKKSRKYLENFLVGINRQTYFNNYDKLVRLQILAEMEEIIAFKDFINSVTGDNSIDGSNYEATSSEKLIEKKKMELLELWSDRLEGIEKNLFYWLEVVSVRTLLFKKSEMMPLMFRFAQLAIQKRKLGLCQRIFLELEEEMTNLKDAEALFMVSAPQTPVSIPPSPEPSRRPLLIALPSQINVTSRQESIRGLEFPPEFQLSKFEKMYMLKELNNEQIYESIKEYFETANVGDTLRGKYCRKLGQWLTESLTDDSPKGYDRVLELFRESLHFNNKVPKTWHLFALTNYKRVLQLTSNKSPVEENRSALQGFVMDAVRGFIQSISLGGPEFTETLQDTLKLLELWFKFGSDSSVRAAVGESFSKIDLTCWLNVVPQLIAKLDMNNFVVLTHVLELLLYVGEKYPQGVIFQLMLASQSKTERRKKSAQQVIDKLRERHPRFIAEAVTIANELHKVAIWQEEEWLEAINEAMTYQAEGKYDLVAKIFLDLHSKMDTPPESQIEMFFYEKYGNMLKEAENLLLHYKKYQDPMAMYQAFEYYIQLQSVLEKSMKDLETIHLKNTSPKLLKIKNSKVVIPGLYDPKQPQVFISGFYDILELMASKRKPRRMKIFGSDGKSYDFLLKGHEDLRQDERVMQSLTLVNTLLKKNENTVKKNLSIITYPVIPLSTNIGLLGWVQGCDTLQQLIKDFRTANHIIKTSELVIMGSQCPNYQIVSFPHKVEVFRYIMDSTKGDDLKKVLWIKSENAEVWLEKRTNYARSLATMSMVGYILGLGDRHLNNLMMKRDSGKIVHIDFGDLFEVTMLRENHPEKVPFRLTRVLIKAMEACGIEGNFRFTCNSVMEVLRENKDSLMAILEAFVTDPLLNWRLIAVENINADGGNKPQIRPIDANGVPDVAKVNDSLVSGRLEIEMKQNIAENPMVKEAEMLNQKALAAVNRIKAKLFGNDFKNHTNLSVTDQVDYLIKQATAYENVCQGWLGWNPFL